MIIEEIDNDIYFAQINNKWAALTPIKLIIKIFKFSKILFF